MKKIILHLSLCLSALFLTTGCQGDYDIRGTIVGVQYTNRMVYLCAPYTLQPIDSTVIRDGKFGFRVPGSSVTVYNLLLQGKSSDILPLDIPVVTGDGVAKVTMGYLSGGGEYGEVKVIKEGESAPFGGAAGTVVSMNPIGFLIDDGKGCRIVQLGDSPLDRVIEKAGELISQISEKHARS